MRKWTQFFLFTESPSCTWYVLRRVCSARKVSRKNVKIFVRLHKHFCKIWHFFAKVHEEKNHGCWSCILSVFAEIFAKILLFLMQKFDFRIFFAKFLHFLFRKNFAVFAKQIEAKFHKNNTKLLHFLFRENFAFFRETDWSKAKILAFFASKRNA